MTVKNINQLIKSHHLDFIDNMNVDLYTDFERPIVTIFTNHASVEDLSKNQDFYKLIARFLYEGGASKHPEFQFAIING